MYLYWDTDDPIGDNNGTQVDVDGLQPEPFWSNPVRLLYKIMPSPPSAQPLKVPATPSKSVDNDKDKTPVATKVSSNQGMTVPVKDISSPHELTAFVRAITTFVAYITTGIKVETLLEQLDSKFDDMSTQILERS